MHSDRKLARRGLAALFAAALVFGGAACGDDDSGVDVDVDENQVEENIDEGLEDVEEGVDEGADELDENVDIGDDAGDEG